jgi:hypothetical protein
MQRSSLHVEKFGSRLRLNAGEDPRAAVYIDRRQHRLVMFAIVYGAVVSLLLMIFIGVVFR